jgi:RNA recognition motif-containing protein
MEKKLYVGNISFQVTEEQIREMFAKIGKVESINLITDRSTGHPKGFGFVEMASEDDARNAIDQLNGSVVMERALTVSEAKPQKPSRQQGYDGFGSRGGKGGYGGGNRSGGPRRR